MGPKPASQVIIAGGSKGDLFECLLSASECTYPANEIIVVDNSHEGLQRDIADSFPKVHVARPSSPLTFAQASNFGLREAIGRGSRIGFLLNDDVTVHHDALGLLIDAEGIGGPGIYAPQIWPYESGAPRTRFCFDWKKRLLKRELVAPDAAAGDIDYAEGSAVAISAEVFEALKGFDEGFGFYYEDADFSVRAKDKGFPVKEIAGARVWHKGSVSAGVGLSPFKAYWRARNALRFAVKHRKHAAVAANAMYHFGEFVFPESLKAAARMLTGSRSDMEVFAAIMRGTVACVTGGRAAKIFEASHYMDVDALPVRLIQKVQ